MKNKSLIRSIAFLALVAIGVSCSDQFEEPSTPNGLTVFDVADAHQDLDIFTAALVKTNLAKSLDNLNSGEYTVFAPHDTAFINYFKFLAITNSATFNDKAVKEAEILAYIKNEMTTTSALSIATLAGRLNYLMVSSKIGSSAIGTGNAFTSIQGARLSLSKSGTDYLINANVAGYAAGNGSQIVTPDVASANGTIHIVNKVLIQPTTASAAASFGLTINYGVNPAVITGGTSNDGNDNNFNLFAAALRKTRLALTILPNASPIPDFTVFAPKDSALRTHYNQATEALAYAVIDTLTGARITDLKTILERHIVSGRLVSVDLVDQAPLTSVSGTSLKVVKVGSYTHVQDNAATLDTKVFSFNTLTNAGVIHGVNKLLK